MNLYDLFITSFEKGGIIMWPILGVSIVAWFVGLDRLLYLNSFKKAREKFHKNINKSNLSVKSSIGLKFYDTLHQNIRKVNEGESSFNYIFREFLVFSIHELEKGFSTMNAWISTAPLLGLLGTVAGMIHTFSVIMEFGIGNPHLMAEGISIALLTTQAGLTVAFPAMLFHNYLMNKKNLLISLLIKDGEELAKRFDQKYPTLQKKK